MPTSLIPSAKERRQVRVRIRATDAPFIFSRATLEAWPGRAPCARACVLCMDQYPGFLSGYLSSREGTGAVLLHRSWSFVQDPQVSRPVAPLSSLRAKPAVRHLGSVGRALRSRVGSGSNVMNLKRHYTIYFEVNPLRLALYKHAHPSPITSNLSPTGECSPKEVS